MRSLVLLVIAAASLCSKIAGASSPSGQPGSGVLPDHQKLSTSAIHTEDHLRPLAYSIPKENLWGEVSFASLPGTSVHKAHSEDKVVDFTVNKGDPSSGGKPEDSQGPSKVAERMVPSATATFEPSSEFPSMEETSPTDKLKRIWRDLISVPPSATQLEQILKGSVSGYDSSSEMRSSPSSPAVNANTSPSLLSKTIDASRTDMGVNSILNSTLLSNQFPLRANGTHQESLYRQVLSQFLDPLASDGKRSLWLDQEFALKLKGSVVIAHHPELWRQIGDGLKPQLNRGIRLLTPSNANEQGSKPFHFCGVSVYSSVFFLHLAHFYYSLLISLSNQF